MKDLWRMYNISANLLSTQLGRTSNLVGEYAEHLAHQHYGGILQTASNRSFDIVDANGTTYQVKSRKINGVTATSLGIIRSWGFKYLVVILFDHDGSVYKALEVPVDVAEKFGVPNKHQNGYVITTTNGFISDPGINDITQAIRALSY